MDSKWIHNNSCIIIYKAYYRHGLRDISQDIYNENLSVCYLTLQFDFCLRLCVINSIDKIVHM